MYILQHVHVIQCSGVADIYGQLMGVCLPCVYVSYSICETDLV